MAVINLEEFGTSDSICLPNVPLEKINEFKIKEGNVHRGKYLIDVLGNYTDINDLETYRITDVKL